MQSLHTYGPLPADDMKKYENRVAELNRAPRHEKPKWFDDELTAFRGRDSLTGQPKYRCVFGQDPEAMIFSCGKMVHKYRLATARQKFRFALRGRPIIVDKEIVGYYETGLIEEKWRDDSIGLPYYFIEKLVFPRCSEYYWEQNIRWYTSIGEGIREDIMGPYPRDGYYEKFLQLVHPDFTPAPPSAKALERIKAKIVEAEAEEHKNRNLTIEQQVQRELDEDAAYQEELDRKCRDDLLHAFLNTKMQALGHSVSFPGARVGAGMNAT